jgi:hypothetical protein
MGDGEVVIVGRADTVAGKSWAWVSKLSRTGVAEWSRDWAQSPGDYSDLFSVIETTGGAIVAAGSAVGWRSEDTVPRLEGLVVKMEPRGSIAWTKTVRLGDRTEVRGVAAADGGRVVIAGALEDRANHWSVFVSTVTSDGEVDAPRIVGQGRLQAIRRLPGNGYVVLSDGGEVLRLDSMLRVLWRRSLEGADAVTGFPDGRIVVVGFADTDREMWVRQIDRDAQLLSERRVRGSAVCRTLATSVWPWGTDELLIAGGSCDDVPSVGLVILTARGHERLSRRLFVAPRTAVFAVRPGLADTLIAAGMFFQDDGPDWRKGWLFRSGSISRLLSQ